MEDQVVTEGEVVETTETPVEESGVGEVGNQGENADGTPVEPTDEVVETTTE